MNPAQFIILLGSSSNGPYLQAKEIFDDYSTYVVADSGTVEAEDCTVNKLLSTFEFNKATELFTPYMDYVETDSGTVEAVNCTINAILELL